MKREVPQPMTATRSALRGRALSNAGAIAAACRQHAGWLAISTAVSDINHLRVTELLPLQVA